MNRVLSVPKVNPSAPGKLYGGLDQRQPFVKRAKNRKVKQARVSVK